VHVFVSQRRPGVQLLVGIVRARCEALDRLRRDTRLGGLRLHLIAVWRSTTLDRELAEGVDPQTSAVLALRAQKLTDPRGRKRIAEGLAGAVRRANDTTPGITAAVRPRARELLDAGTLLAALDRRLRGSGLISAQGVAMLRALLTDAASPLYQPSGPGELASRLRAAAAALDLQKTPRGMQRDRTREGGAPQPVPKITSERAAVRYLDVPDDQRAVDPAELAQRPSVAREEAGR